MRYDPSLIEKKSEKNNLKKNPFRAAFNFVWKRTNSVASTLATYETFLTNLAVCFADN